MSRALEGALKLREISSIHTEGYPAADHEAWPLGPHRHSCEACGLPTLVLWCDMTDGVEAGVIYRATY